MELAHPSSGGRKGGRERVRGRASERARERQREAMCTVDSIILPKATSTASERRQISGNFDPNQNRNFKIHRMSQLEEILAVI